MCTKSYCKTYFQHSSEYPALTCALNLLDEVFDLQARSQWLRRGLINRLLGRILCELKFIEITIDKFEKKFQFQVLRG